MKKNYKINLGFAMAALFLGIFLTSQPIMACSNLGPDKHLGVVQAIDAAKGELIVIDAESQKPILFSITSAQLKQLKPKDTVMITFKSDAGRLVVQNLVVRSLKMSAL